MFFYFKANHSNSAGFHSTAAFRLWPMRAYRSVTLTDFDINERHTVEIQILSVNIEISTNINVIKYKERSQTATKAGLKHSWSPAEKSCVLGPTNPKTLFLGSHKVHKCNHTQTHVLDWLMPPLPPLCSSNLIQFHYNNVVRLADHSSFSLLPISKFLWHEEPPPWAIYPRGSLQRLYCSYAQSSSPPYM